MPSKRSAMGYEECVNCSKEAKWSGVPIIHHKTGNEIQIVKDPRDAAEFMAKSSRGFGASRGVAGSYNFEIEVKEATSAVSPEKPKDRIVGRKKPDTSKYDDENVGKEAIEIAEKEGYESGKFHLEREYQALRISPSGRKRVLAVLTQFFSDSK